MKKLFLFLSFTFSVVVFAQNIKADIEKQFREYNSLIVDENFEKAIDLYANEDFLKIFPKEKMVELMNQMFNSPDFEFKIGNLENIFISDQISEENGKYFVKLSYHQDLDMKFLANDVSSEIVLSALQTEFGYNNVKYNEKTDFFEIRSDKNVVASSSDSKNWKFTVLEKKNIPILKYFIPEQFLKEL